MVLLSMATGVMLKFVYIAAPDRAYDSIIALHTTVRFGPFLRNLHHWSANLLVLVVFFHMLRIFYTGAYKENRQLNWLVGLALMVAVVLSNFTGYLLPWDQLAYWAVTICTSMLPYVPWIGGWLQGLIVGGQELGPQTLSNFFALHTAILPVVFVLLLPFHFWRIRKAGGLAARADTTGESATKEDRIEVIPHLIVRETAMALCVIALVMVMAALWDAPLEAKANPGLSPNPTKAPWYFAGLQEMLLHLHPLVAVTVIPIIAIVSLGLLPYLPFEVHVPGLWFGTYKGRRMAAAGALAAVIVTPMWVIGYARGMAFLSWLAPLAGGAAVLCLWYVSKHRFKTTAHESVQAAFAFFSTVFIILTLTGIWFRGASMALVWPWQ